MSREDDLKKLIELTSRHLQILREQIAFHGEPNAPAGLILQAQDTEAKLESLQAELESLKIEKCKDSAVGISETTNTSPLDLLPSNLPNVRFFAGREVETKRLKSLLNSNRLIILEGLSGIGKTTLASHYVYEAVSNYQSVIWYEIQDDDTVRSVLDNIADQLNGQGKKSFADAISDPQKNRSSRIRALNDFLRKTKAILVFDAFENCLDDSHEIDAEFATLFSTLFQAKFQSHLLALTKIKPKINPTYLGQYEIFELGGLTGRDTTKLVSDLCQSYGYSINANDANKIFIATDGHPFTLKIIVQLLINNYELSDLLRMKSPVAISDYDTYLDILYAKLSSESITFIETCAAFRRPFDLSAVKYLRVSEQSIRELSSFYFLDVDRQSQQYSIHAIIRRYAYGKLGNDLKRRQKIHRVIGDYYLSFVSRVSGKPDPHAVSLILEAQYHYGEADHRPGQLAIGNLINRKLKGYIRELVKQGETKLARQFYYAVFAADEADSEIHQDYGRLLEIISAEPQQIQYHFWMAAKLAPSNPQRQMDYLVRLVRNENFYEARKQFQIAVKSCHTSDKIYVPYAKELIVAKRFKDAERVLESGLDNVNKPALSSVYLMYGTLLKHQRRWDEAIFALKKALTLVPRQKGLDDIYLMCSQILQQKGDLEKAASVLQDGINRVHPSSTAKLYVEYSRVLKDRGLPDEAKQILRQGVTHVPPENNLYSLYVAYSDLLRDEKDLRGAASILKEGIRCVPAGQKSDALCLEYSKVIRSLGNRKEAERALKEGIARTPPGRGLTTLYLDYCNLLASQHRFDEAESVLDEALNHGSRRSKSVIRKRQKKLVEERIAYQKRTRKF